MTKFRTKSDLIYIDWFWGGGTICPPHFNFCRFGGDKPRGVIWGEKIFFPLWPPNFLSTTGFGPPNFLSTTGFGPPNFLSTTGFGPPNFLSTTGFGPPKTPIIGHFGLQILYKNRKKSQNFRNLEAKMASKLTSKSKMAILTTKTKFYSIFCLF